MNKIRLVCAMILCSNYLYGMEAEPSFTYAYGNTQINLVKGNIENFDGKAAIIALSENKLATSYLWDHNKNIIVSGIEPELYMSYDEKNDTSVLCYHRYLQASPDGDVRLHKFYQGEQAIKRAEKELCKVYQNALVLGNLRRLKKNNPNKTIAMSLLGTTHFPRNKAAKCAISAIINRITQYPGDYDIMYLVINSDSDVAECKKLLEGYIR